MSQSENLEMFNVLPMDNPDAAKKKKKSSNILQDNLAQLMSERKVEMADIHKATGIPYPTLCDWCFGTVETQRLDDNIKKLAQFFNVTIDYLAFGIGDDSPAYGKFEDKKEA